MILTICRTVTNIVSTKTPTPGVMKFGRFFYAFLYMTEWRTPKKRTSVPGLIKFTIFNENFIHTDTQMYFTQKFDRISKMQQKIGKWDFFVKTN